MFRAAVIASLALMPLASCRVCPYMESSTPIVFELPASALSHPLVDLPVKFNGVTPVMTRKQMPFGSTPKITITKYSSMPVVAYDPVTESVIISAGACVGAPEDGGSGATSTFFSRSGGVLAATTLGLVAAAHTSMGGSKTGALAMTTAAAMMALATQTSATQLRPRELSESCSPSALIEVEAPAAYQGAVEVCLAEVSEKGHCPLPFPTFETSDDPNPTCGVAVVGGGAGGIYTALRMVDAGKIDASDVCIFEMTERVGGRIFSLRGFGPDGDLSVDAGGYRTWREFTPTTHALITEYLDIPMDCYDTNDVPCQKYNIVDKNGKKAGFATFVEEMARRLIDAGAHWYPYHELDSIAKVPAVADPNLGDADVQLFDVPLNTELYFSNGAKATATFTTILNMPQRPLLNVLRNSDLDTSVVDEETLDALHSVQTVIASKLYLYYPRGQVFWRKLGLNTGDFERDGDARNMLLAGRYHDGHVECDDDDDPNTCHGFLLAVYANDLSGNKAQFFRRYQRERPEPVTIMSNSDLEGAGFLKHAHSILEQYHMYENMNANYTGSEAMAAFRNVEPPTFGVLSTWNPAIPWAGGAWHAWTELDNMEKAMQPLVDSNIYVVNEAFGLLHGWAEGSIKLADTILEEHFGVARPWDFAVNDLVQFVQQTNSQECAEVALTSGGSGGGGGAEAEAVNPALCFTADALVTMADGSFKRIADVQPGDHVATTGSGGQGLVTEALVHPVQAEVSVAIVSTKQGDLIGTPDHPILHDGNWVAMSELPNELYVLTLDHQHYVDAFYNLEVDGDDPYKGTHSYMVNGIVASGLGDNEVLNRLFPRQKEWMVEDEKTIAQDTAAVA